MKFATHRTRLRRSVDIFFELEIHFDPLLMQRTAGHIVERVCRAWKFKFPITIYQQHDSCELHSLSSASKADGLSIQRWCDTQRKEHLTAYATFGETASR